MEAAQGSVSRGVDKITIILWDIKFLKCMGHLYNGILLGGKSEENFTLCDGMDGPGEYYAK